MSAGKVIVPQTAAQRAVVARALKLKAAMQITADADFYRRVLHPHLGWSDSTWHRLREDEYQAKADKKIRELEAVLNLLSANMTEQGHGLEVGGSFHPNRWWDECRLSVEICAQRVMDPQQNKERATLLVAGPDLGKTAIARNLTAWAKGGDGKTLFPGGAFLRECDESWRTHKPIFEHFADMLGIEGTWRGGKDVSEAVVYELKKRGPTFVALDECQYWTPHTVNALKMLINKTPIVPFFDCTPELLAQFRNKSWESWDQMRARIFRTVTVGDFNHRDLGPGITVNEVLPFLQPFNLNGTAERIAAEIAESASFSGGFARIKGVADVVAFKFDGAWTLANTRAAIEEVERAKGIDTAKRERLQKLARKQTTETTEGN